MISIKFAHFVYVGCFEVFFLSNAPTRNSYMGLDQVICVVSNEVILWPRAWMTSTHQSNVTSILKIFVDILLRALLYHLVFLQKEF